MSDWCDYCRDEGNAVLLQRMALKRQNRLLKAHVAACEALIEAMYESEDHLPEYEAYLATKAALGTGREG